MRKLWWGLLLAAMAGSGAAAEVPVPVIENAGYTFCVNEANDAMTLGRLVMAFGRTRQQIEDDPRMTPFFRGMAADFFRDVEAGKVHNYAQFALHRFQQCLQVQKVDLHEEDLTVFACLTRMDIPYYYFALKRNGDSQAEAAERMGKALAPWHYPPGLIEALGGPAWSVKNENELKAMQIFLFNACLLPSEEVSHYYGMPPPGAAPAPAPGADAPTAPAPR